MWGAFLITFHNGPPGSILLFVTKQVRPNALDNKGYIPYNIDRQIKERFGSRLRQK
jgi:hypothetical protein